MQYQSTSAEQTEQIGIKIAKTLHKGDIICLSGELGAGKTTLVRGILRGFGYEGRVTSPTFALCNAYQTPAGEVLHFDLYRLPDEDALLDIGFDEQLAGGAICLIEWSENAGALLPARRKIISLCYGQAEDARQITVKECGQ